ncbi:MAG: NTP transferase domain-containing protein [Desulforegulaceae bacterium]|nr:NTP transferase domain-containing protein [Desulforegulaceae bacterium]
MGKKDWCVIILAGGKGKRMESDLPKVLHEVDGKSMVLRVCEAASGLSDNIVVVVGHEAEDVKSAILKSKKVKFAFQENQNGTGDAVKSAIKHLDLSAENIMVLCGDTPLIRSETLIDFASTHSKGGFDVSVLGMELENPTGYGRLIKDENGNIVKIVEQADADDLEKAVKLVNSGIYCFDKDFLTNGLLKINCSNAQEEYYLTDLVSISYLKNNNKVGCHILNNPLEAVGVNSKKELELARVLFKESYQELN